MSEVQLVDIDSGELAEPCEHCAPLVKELQDTVKVLKRDVRTWSRRALNAEEDKTREALAHPLWETGREIFNHWLLETGKASKKKKPAWTADRFWLLLPFLERDGEQMCRRAITGRVYDHYVDRRKNGTEIHYYEWERIFANRGNFEESVNRAPRTAQDDLLERSEEDKAA